MRPLKHEITGDRIVLRRLRLSDAGDFFELANNRGVSRWLAHMPYPYPKAAAVAFIRRSQRLWRAKKGFHFGIVEREGGRVIGCIGLGRYENQHRCAQLGYWLGKPFWHRGLTTEAVGLILQFGFGPLRLYRIYADVFASNPASQNILKKCGFQQEGVRRQVLVRYGRRHDIINFGLLKPEYLGKPAKQRTSQS